MSDRSILPTLALAVAASAAPIAEAASQAPEPATVTGTVFDSITHTPLEDAAVFLWQTSYKGVSDAQGRFAIEGVPPGRYHVLFFHTLLGEMGASPGPRTIEVGPGEALDIELATPSMFTLVASECFLEGHPPHTGTVAGWVGDGETGTGMPGAHVTLSWSRAEEDAPQAMHLRTDAGGWYRTCEAPADVPIVASASFLDREGARREVVVPDGGTVEAGFLLYHLSPSALHGRLVDGNTDMPVADAEVRLRGSTHMSVTRADGTFDFPQVRPGTYMLITEHLRYGTRRDTLRVPSGERLNVEMRVQEQPIEVAPLTVEVEAAPLTERAMGGTTITRSDIERVRERVRDVADIMQTQHIPGVIVRRRQDGSLCVGFMPGQVRMHSRGCESMLIFINNVRANSESLAFQIPPEAIDHIIVYRPVEAGNLFGLGSANGVMTIFTR